MPCLPREQKLIIGSVIVLVGGSTTVYDLVTNDTFTWISGVGVLSALFLGIFLSLLFICLRFFHRQNENDLGSHVDLPVPTN